MKALAAEMVANFGRRLEPLGITVRELTGDMQLTKKEITNTQVYHPASQPAGRPASRPIGRSVGLNQRRRERERDV